MGRVEKALDVFDPVPRSGPGRSPRMQERRAAAPAQQLGFNRSQETDIHKLFTVVRDQAGVSQGALQRIMVQPAGRKVAQLGLGRDTAAFERYRDSVRDVPDAIDRDHLDVLHLELPRELVVPDAFDPEHPDREADAFTSQGASPAQPVVERPVVVHDKGPAAWSGGDEIGLVKRRQRLANRRPAGREALGKLMLTGESGPYIEFKHVSKAFGENRVLDDVSFSVDPGETVCILGRSGVGKSVSLQHILGFLKPDSGRVIVAHEDITDYSEDELERIRKKVTMVFQSGALFDSLTVGENVAFPLRERRDLNEEQILQIVSGLLEMVGVKEMAEQFPSDLSTGMKRSVAIARALASQPECVLYDEPTTMVDPLMGQLLGDLLKRLKIQLHLTSVVVTHDMRLAKKLADRVVFLYEARVLFFGTYPDMEKCSEPIVQEFLKLDELDIGA